MQEGTSYIRGADVPLIEKTISKMLAETAARYPDREALVVCHQGVRLTWRRTGPRGDTRTARGLRGWACVPATAPASGPATAWSGFCCSTPRRAPAWCW